MSSSPGLAGRPCFAVQPCRRGMNRLLVCIGFDAAENEKSISAFRVLSVGRAIFPAVSFGLSSAGQCRVMAHQTMSSRKLFPSPLSPVKRFRRGPKSSDMLDAGPTLDMPRCVIKPETPLYMMVRRALPACRIPEPCQQFKEAACQSRLSFHRHRRHDTPSEPRHAKHL